MKLSKFTGPLFILGMPRSGTKLLRDLLNQNPKIGIPPAETNFIPYMIKRFGNAPSFENDNEFDRFLKELRKTTFWEWMKPYGLVFRKEYLDKEADKKSWNSIFEVILRYYAPFGRSEDFIWGDKSPTYLCHMILLKKIFPEAKFLHIIRDPRDCCLSTKKAWGKNLYRTAELWRRTLKNAKFDGCKLGKDYMEVLYEALLDDPEKVMRSICDFVGCDFNLAMTELKKPSENLGDTKGQARIVKNNKKKYIIELSSSEIKRIEEIVYPVAKALPYKFEHDVEFKPLSPLMFLIHTLYDGLAMIKFHVHERGLLHGISFFYRGLRPVVISRARER